MKDEKPGTEPMDYLQEQLRFPTAGPLDPPCTFPDIEQHGKEYAFVSNVDKGDVNFRKYLRSKGEGLDIIFEENPPSTRKRFPRLAVYVDRTQRHLLEQSLKR